MTKQQFLRTLYKIGQEFKNIKPIIKKGDEARGVRTNGIYIDDERVWVWNNNGKLSIGYTGGYKHEAYRKVIISPRTIEYLEGIVRGYYGKCPTKVHTEKNTDRLKAIRAVIDDVGLKTILDALVRNDNKAFYIETKVLSEKTIEEYSETKEITRVEDMELPVKTSLTKETQEEFVWVEA